MNVISAEQLFFVANELEERTNVQMTDPADSVKDMRDYQFKLTRTYISHFISLFMHQTSPVGFLTVFITAFSVIEFQYFLLVQLFNLHVL